MSAEKGEFRYSLIKSKISLLTRGILAIFKLLDELLFFNSAKVLRVPMRSFSDFYGRIF